MLLGFLEGLTGLLVLVGELISAPSEMASFDTMIPEESPLQLPPAPSGLTSAPYSPFQRKSCTVHPDAALWFSIWESSESNNQIIGTPGHLSHLIVLLWLHSLFPGMHYEGLWWMS